MSNKITFNYNPMDRNHNKLMEEVSVEEAITRLQLAMFEDKDYAWSWFCNLKMTCYDNTNCNLAYAEAFAIDFMCKCFKFTPQEMTDLIAKYNKPNLL